jgi:hypothetical protein
MHKHSQRRSATRGTLVCCAAVVSAAGCGPKNVRWNYAPGTPRRLAEARQVALLADREIRVLADAAAAELTFHGYGVTVYEPVAEPRPSAPPAPKPPADGPPPSVPDLVIDLSARYVREPVPGTRVRVWPWVAVDVAHGKPKEWYILVTDAKLELRSARKDESLGSVMVHFDKPQEDIQKVAKKLAEGLEQIRKGKRPKTD